jgi:Flp pilus assembly protein TadB
MRALQQQAWSKQYRRKEEEHRTEGTEKKKQKEIKQKRRKTQTTKKSRKKKATKTATGKAQELPQATALAAFAGPRLVVSFVAFVSFPHLSLSFSLFYFCFHFVSFTLCFL